METQRLTQEIINKIIKTSVLVTELTDNIFLTCILIEAILRANFSGKWHCTPYSNLYNTDNIITLETNCNTLYIFRTKE